MKIATTLTIYFGIAWTYFLTAYAFLETQSELLGFITLILMTFAVGFSAITIAETNEKD